MGALHSRLQLWNYAGQPWICGKYLDCLSRKQRLYHPRVSPFCLIQSYKPGNSIATSQASINQMVIDGTQAGSFRLSGPLSLMLNYLAMFRR
jgi:hypothetical protein